MAKRDAPKKDNAKGRSKASARAGTRTAQNKQRQEATRQRKLARRMENGKLVILEVRANDGSFKSARGKRRARMIEQAERSEIQIERIERKRATRERLRACTPKERAARREAGQRQFAHAKANAHAS
jgi:hypothetical protein